MEQQGRRGTEGLVWPSNDFTQTPYEVFLDPKIFDEEQEKIFRGPTWNFLGLECELKDRGDFFTCYVGTTPVVVSRGLDDKLHAFINRCTHRGGPIVRELRGNAKSHTCIYHQWSYSSEGALVGVPFQRGQKGQCGYPDDFKKEDHNPQQMRVEVHSGVIFGTFSRTVEPLLEYLGPTIANRIALICNRPLKVIGYQRHVVRANWKLFCENTRDGYHGPLLHSFTAWGIFQASQKGMIETDETGRHSLISAYVTESKGPRPALEHAPRFQLEDTAMVEVFPELPNGLANSVISIFPSTLFTVVNTLSVRQIRPKAPDRYELVYTYFAYEDDDEETLARRRKQQNLWGPCGYVAVEDTEVVEQMQQRLATDGSASILEMGGRGHNSADQLLTEATVRSFWRGYCNMMGIPAAEAAVAAE